jgi:hypothetical protein
MTMRNLARVGATGLLAAGTLALAAGPAFAADVDFGLNLKGTTIAVGASSKPATISFTNYGTSTPSEVEVLFDATELDDSKVKIDLGECTFEDGIADCVIDASAIPGPGETSDLDVPLVKQAGATGAAGKLTVTVLVEGDTNEANNSKTVDVTVGGSGVDLRVVAPDVTEVDDSGDFTGKAIPPGGSSLVEGYIANHGDMVARGLKVQLSLPKDVTFTEEQFSGCDYSADHRSVDCELPGYPLIPSDLDTSPTKENSALMVLFPVTVSKDAKGPVALKGGVLTAAAISQQDVPDVSILAKEAAPTLPEMAKTLTAAEIAELDVDASDNTDDFAVLVAGQTGGSHGGGSGPDDDGLPITGPVAASVGGAGLAVIVAGAMMFLAARRRRIVLVTPDDEK